MKEHFFTLEITGFGPVKVIVRTASGRVKTHAEGFGFREHGVLNESTGELITNGNDITTNYLAVASELALKRLGYNVKVSKTSPCDRAIKILKGGN